jgi:hypothetical protein
MASPNRRDNGLEGRLHVRYLRWLSRAVTPMDARWSKSLLESLSHCATLVVLIAADRGREGVQRSKSRYLWHCGDFRHKVFGRARFPGCADVVLRWRSHERWFLVKIALADLVSSSDNRRDGTPDWLVFKLLMLEPQWRVPRFAPNWVKDTDGS